MKHITTNATAAAANADARPDRSALRQARLRARRAGLPDPMAPQPCTQCPRMVRWGSLGAATGLCSRCWEQSESGREWNRQRCADHRAAINAIGAARKAPQATPPAPAVPPAPQYE